MIPEDDLDTGIRHAMLHADLGRIYDISKEKKKVQLPDEDPLKIARKSQRQCLQIIKIEENINNKQ